METGILEFDCVGMENGGKFPTENTGRGQNLSPEFVLKNLSPAAETIVITLEDLSHPVKNFTHWVIWDLPAAGRIHGGIPAGGQIPALGNARQGIGYGFHRYAGPKPPKGKRHIYRFTMYALDCRLGLNSFAMKGSVLKKMRPHILQTGAVTGVFE